MQKILWNNTLNKVFALDRGNCIWMVCYIPMMINLVKSGENLPGMLMLFLCAFVVAVGAMEPRFSESVFFMPVSRKERQKAISKFVRNKLIICGMICGVLLLVGGLLHMYNAISAILLTLDCVTISYVIVVGNGYVVKKSQRGLHMMIVMFVLIITTIATVVMGACYAPPVTMGVMAVIYGIIYIVIWSGVKRDFEIMSASCADYEYLRIINLSLEERAKLQERGEL